MTKLTKEQMTFLEKVLKPALTEAESVFDEAAAEAEGYFDDRSEGWQEGDRGQAYEEWMGQLREFAESLSEAMSLADDITATPG